MMIPELAALVKRDKGSNGDYRGDKKLKARKELSFIYLMLDFQSPISNLPFEDKRAQAMLWTSLEEKDIDGDVMAAYHKYQELLYISSPTLITLDTVKKAHVQFLKYFNNLDFTKEDKQGKLQFTTGDYQTNVKRLRETFRTFKELEQEVMLELKQDSGIRGMSEKGDNEGKKREVWTEGRPAITDNTRTYQELGQEINEDDE